MRKFINTLHHYFVPRHTNNYTAKLLHHDFLTIYLLIALLLTMGVRHISQGSNVLGYATDVTVNKLHELTNKERTKYNLSTLNYNEKLADAARRKASDMFEKNYWAHYGPAGETPWDFILEAGYQYEYAGENLAKNFLFSGDIVEAWMDSPTHKENIIRKEYTDVGFAVVNGILNGEETTLVVQMFGAPLYANADVPAANQEDSTIQQPVVQEEMGDIKAAPVKQVVVERAEKKDSPAFFPIYFNLNMLFFIILIAALLLDFYFAAKLNLIRVKGKNLVHLMFIVFVLIGSFILIKGSIS